LLHLLIHWLIRPPVSADFPARRVRGAILQ
jgi:hypothetical protein